MNRLNNKGFAISTVIYGISIMGIMLMAMIMASMSAIRKNNNELAKTIEEDLNRFSKTEARFAPIISGDVPAVQEYTVPLGEDGWYRIELWGTQGGTNGGRGAYTSGIIELKAEDTLYFYVGNRRDDKGGYSTEVRLNPTGYMAVDSSRIMVAAGGGTNPGADGGTLVGQNANMASTDGQINIVDKSYQLTSTHLNGYPDSFPTSSSGLPSGCSSGEKPNKNSLGGDGYKGGASASIGGMSFMAGFAGCAKDVGGHYFVDGLMMAGVRVGNGEARIEKLISKDDEVLTLPRKNKKLEGITGIRDCTNTLSAANLTSAVVMSGGSPVSLTESSASKVGSVYCKSFTWSGAKNVDEIATWHTSAKIGGVDVINNMILVNQGGEWKPVKDILKNSSAEIYNKASETETPAGTRISAYQHDPMIDLPLKGDYYLIPVLSENKVVTAAKEEKNDVNPITFDYLTGDKRQKWSIEKITSTAINPTGANEYKVVELARHKALAIDLDENMLKNKVSAQSIFNDYARNEPQIWKVISMGDGTYVITTVVETFDDRNNIISGSLVAQTSPDVGDTTQGMIVISRSSDAAGNIFYHTQRFRLFDVNYSSTS